MNSIRLALICCFVCFSCCLPAGNADDVRIVHGLDAPPLEILAARTIQAQFGRLELDRKVTVGAMPSPEPQTTILVGSPESNPEIARLFTDWPEISDQGIVIKTLSGKRTYIVGGGSPAATLWAAYEFGHRRGIRYLPRGDMYPLQMKPLKLAKMDTVMEPTLKSRAWRATTDSPIGPASWGTNEYKRFLTQLSKMKFNRVVLSVHPWQPYVHYEYGGVTKKKATHWYGERFPLEGETVGKKAFGGSKLFENPEFAGVRSSAEAHVAGRKHMQAIMEAAHERGMSVGMRISPCEFPRRFQKVLPETAIVQSSNNLSLTAGGKTGPFDDSFRKLVSTKIRAVIETYPSLDTLYFSLPDYPEWTQHAAKALQQLKERGAPADLTLKSLISATVEKTADDARRAQTLQANLVGLSLFQSLLDDEKLLKRPDGQTVELVVENADPALVAHLSSVLPQGFSGEWLIPLANDNVSILPQSQSQAVSDLVGTVMPNDWDGFAAQFRMPAEHDPAMYYLSRVSWEKDLTAENAVRELWTTTTGNASAADRLWQAWQHLETATDLINEHAQEFALPTKDMLLKHQVDKPLPEWWQEATDAYTKYMVELYRAHGAIDGDAKPILFYYAKRSEFALEYLGAVKAVRETHLAKSANDMETALEHFETALEQTHNCINTLSDVARDQSDRGLIAVLNAYAWRPLLAEYEKLADAN